MSPLFFVCCPRIGGMIAGESLLKSEGNQRSWQSGSSVKSFAWCKRFRGNPSVSATHCQFSTRHALRVPFQESPIKPPLKGVTPHGVGRCPQGRGDRSVRGGLPLGGGGVLLWNLLLGVKDLGITPQSVLRTASSPKGEPNMKPFKEGILQYSVSDWK